MWKTYISVVILPCAIGPTYNSDPNRRRESTLIAGFIEGRNKANTLGIGTYWHCSLEVGSYVIRGLSPGR